MLDQPRKAGGRSVSHMLTSHGGELFIHTLAAARSPLEDPPSISEGAGGRVTDYRIKVLHLCSYLAEIMNRIIVTECFYLQDFGELMHLCRLAPSAEENPAESPLGTGK